MLSKEYRGEVALPLDDWFVDKQTGSFGFDQSATVCQYLDLSVQSSYFRFAADHPSPLALPE